MSGIKNVKALAVLTVLAAVSIFLFALAGCGDDTGSSDPAKEDGTITVILTGAEASNGRYAYFGNMVINLLINKVMYICA